MAERWRSHPHSVQKALDGGQAWGLERRTRSQLLCPPASRRTGHIRCHTSEAGTISPFLSSSSDRAGVGGEDLAQGMFI